MNHPTFKKITIIRSFYSSTATSNSFRIATYNFNVYFMLFLSDGNLPPFLYILSFFSVIYIPQHLIHYGNHLMPY
nr:MAG TPA: hypothetical protein [Caudoviricetes sp.]